MTEYWHFLPDNRRLQYGRRTLVKAGQTLKIESQPVLCRNGFHFSERAIDALRYAPGPIICRVTVGGIVVMGDDKGCAQERTVIWMADATRTLHEFACWCATKALDDVETRGGKVDPSSRRAIAVKLLWLDGKATDKELREARSYADAYAAAYAYDAYAAAYDAYAAASYAASYYDSYAAAAAAEMDTELERRLMALAPQ